jgi:hypothetical protein
MGTRRTRAAAASTPTSESTSTSPVPPVAAVNLRRSTRTSSRDVITPSPTIPEESADIPSIEDVVMEIENEESDDDDDDGDGDGDGNAQKQKNTTKTKKPPPKKSASAASTASTPAKKSKSESKPSSSRKRKSSKQDQDGDSLFFIAASESDSDDEKDRPFRIEYSATGRATCRSCDEKIEKNVIRASCRPMFRGKPGFVSYRHLKCQIFPSEITKINEVGGWRKLKSEDRLLLKQQLEESERRIDEENKEMKPDELIQTAFQGVLREAPKGLVGNLLPFQREGVCWMYNQEVNLKEVKGGILAGKIITRCHFILSTSCAVLVSSANFLLFFNEPFFSSFFFHPLYLR